MSREANMIDMFERVGRKVETLEVDLARLKDLLRKCDDGIGLIADVHYSVVKGFVPRRKYVELAALRDRIKKELGE